MGGPCGRSPPTNQHLVHLKLTMLYVKYISTKKKSGSHSQVIQLCKDWKASQGGVRKEDRCTKLVLALSPACCGPGHLNSITVNRGSKFLELGMNKSPFLSEVAHRFLYLSGSCVCHLKISRADLNQYSSNLSNAWYPFKGKKLSSVSITELWC